MSIPSESDLRRFFNDEAMAREVYHAEIITSWVSLRILDNLYRKGPTSTGELARGLNMDMREVSERLEQLAEIGIVTECNGNWEAISKVTIDVERGNGVVVSHSLMESTESGETVPNTEDDDEHGPLANIIRRLIGMLRF